MIDIKERLTFDANVWNNNNMVEITDTQKSVFTKCEYSDF